MPSLERASSSISSFKNQLKFMGRALRHRNFRLFFYGQIVSLVGTWIGMVATSWLVYRLCRDSQIGNPAFMLGLVGFAGQAPIFFITPLAGVWADRADKRKILVGTQFFSMLQSLVLAYLTLTHQITVVQVLFLSLLQGFINAFDMPTRQSFVVEMVEDRKDLANAIALNSSMVHTARLVGPSVAGFLIYKFGEGVCFLIDSLSYCAVLFALLALRVPKRVSVAHVSAFRELREGFRYGFGSIAIRTLLLVVGVTSLMFAAQSVLMPIVADKILHGNERVLGILLGASGLGALGAALYLASRKSIVGLGKVIAGALFSLGTGFLLFALSRTLVVSVIILVVMGSSIVLLMASSNTILQTITDDDKRGRVMSLFTFAFMGMAPFGSLICGTVANWIGAPSTFALCGSICFLVGYFYVRILPLLRSQIRPIYQAKGILPPPEITS